MIKLNQTFMNETFNAMLMSGERLLSPVYCGFNQTGILGVLGGPSNVFGFVALTSTGRMLIVQSCLGRTATGSAYIQTATKVKIKDAMLGQKVIDITFPDGKKDFRVKFQVSPKVIGCDFPDQGDNLKSLLYVLEKRAEGLENKK